jgi:hypothetical protein
MIPYIAGLLHCISVAISSIDGRGRLSIKAFSLATDAAFQSIGAGAGLAH